jgi:C1A family cysteine protease
MAKRTTKKVAASTGASGTPDGKNASSVHWKQLLSLPADVAPPDGLTRRRVASFGWHPDLPDPRDQFFSVAGPVLQALPASVDLRAQDGPIYDQGRIGSCTANAISGAVQFDRRKLGLSPDFVPSRLFIYYNERSIEGHVGTDSGAHLRDGIKSVNQLGVCPETEWPYDDTPAEYDGGPFPPGAKEATKPSAKAYTDAKTYQVVSYQRLSNVLAQLKGALAQGYPFVLGFPVFQNIYDASGRPKTHIPLPGGPMIGGHAVMAVGYTDSRQEFIIRNSWGSASGDKGYFYLPFAYVASYASDFWVIRGVSR